MSQPIPLPSVEDPDLSAAEMFSALLAAEQQKLQWGCAALLAYCEHRVRVRNELLAMGKAMGLVEAAPEGLRKDGDFA